MLDAFLSRGGGFGGSHVIGNVAYEKDMLAFGGSGNREIRGSAQPRLHLDEIHASLLELAHVFGGFHGVANDKGGLKRRRAAVEIRPGEKNARAEAFTFFDFAEIGR